MKLTEVNPRQVIALRDYPLHDNRFLELYYSIYKQGGGNLLAPVPVIAIGEVLDYLKGYSRDCMFRDFKPVHPDSDYFLIDGNHRSIAAALAGKPIFAMWIREKADLMEAHRLQEQGGMTGWANIPFTIGDLAYGLANHHATTDRFMTVEEKAIMLAKNNQLPRYIIEEFCSK
ncbi:MAG: hypothetical protein WC471_03195 [Candidatus Woesearchaeota archaeon]